mgnify:CR=1 FL=1
MGWGEFFALGSAFFWALAVILFRRIDNALPAFELNLFKNLLGFVLIWPVLLFFEGAAMPDYSAFELLAVVLSGFLGIAVADTWYLRALNLMGASRTGIVSSLLSPFVILLSIVFLSESLQGWQLAGFGLVMAGILLVTWQANREADDPQELRLGLFFGIGAVFLMAVGVVLVKEILEQRPFIWTTQLRLGGGVVGMLLYMALRGHYRKVWANFRKPLPWGLVIVGSFLGSFVSMMMWLGGYKLIPASEASVLNQSANAWIVALAWLVLGEYIGFRKVAGLVLTTVGVLIMILV